MSAIPRSLLVAACSAHPHHRRAGRRAASHRQQCQARCRGTGGKEAQARTARCQGATAGVAAAGCRFGALPVGRRSQKPGAASLRVRWWMGRWTARSSGSPPRSPSFSARGRAGRGRAQRRRADGGGLDRCLAAAEGTGRGHFREQISASHQPTGVTGKRRANDGPGR